MTKQTREACDPTRERDWKGLALSAALFAVVTIIATTPGCAMFDDRVEVPVPIAKGYADQLGAEPDDDGKLTIEETEYAMARFDAVSPIDRAQWQVRLDDAITRRETRNNFISDAWAAANDILSIAGVPVGGPLATALAVFTPYFLGRNKLAKEKQRSYNTGLARGAAAAKPAFNPNTADVSVTGSA